MQKTTIPWTDYSWNPSVGCENKCVYCYARKLHNKRHKAYLAGKKLPKQYAKPFEEIQLFPERLEAPLHKRKPCKIFVGSVADLFSPSVPFEFIYQVFNIIRQSQQHIFQILTKRPQRLFGIYKNYPKRAWPISPNLWPGVTTENQKTADERIPILLQIPAAVWFVSCEPLLGEIDISEYLPHLHYPKTRTIENFNNIPAHPIRKTGLDWVIIGCESGPGKRECRFEWVQSLVEQCKAAGVKVFVKQLSINGKVNKNMSDWPAWARLREMPK